MKINSIILYKSSPMKTENRKDINASLNHIGNDSKDIMSGLEMLSAINKISFKGADKQKFELAQSIDELDYRTNSEQFGIYKMLDVDTPQYKQLAKGDKKALVHLVRAAKVLDDVYIRQDDAANISFRDFLEKESQKGNERAQKTLTLFNAQKGINAKDRAGADVNLATGQPVHPGKGFYPAGMDAPHFHKILIKMLNDGETEEVKKILNQRTMVVEDGEKLKAIDYTDYFKTEFKIAANELEQAALTSTDNDFSQYLVMQTYALRKNNPLFDAVADRKWATLQDTPLEFTIARESYDDKLTPSVLTNPELKELLKKHDITPYAKDSIGVRVGIVNKSGTDYILKMKKYLPLMAENMPYNDEYEQNISRNGVKQTMVDVDVVAATGGMGDYRGAISLASNLPNNDKMAIKIGGGKRNVYHIQMREAKYSDNVQHKLDALLDKSQHKYYDFQALHDFTILHENVHSLGPKQGVESLGEYKNIIEEHKADMGALAMMDVLRKEGFYSPEQTKKIMTSFAVAYVFKGENNEDAHRVRNTMQHNYFIQNGAIDVDKNGIMKINYDRMLECAKEMFDKSVAIQIDKDKDIAKKYIEEYGVWSDELEAVAVNLRKTDKQINARVVSPLADKLLMQS